MQQLVYMHHLQTLGMQSANKRGFYEASVTAQQGQAAKRGMQKLYPWECSQCNSNAMATRSTQSYGRQVRTVV